MWTRRLLAAVVVGYVTAMVVAVATMAYRDLTTEPVVLDISDSAGPHYWTIPPKPVWSSPTAWVESWALGLAVGAVAGAVYYRRGRHGDPGATDV